jgi:hypothetical protein
VINRSALDWVEAARTGRADVLVMGDSTVGTFYAGIERAINKHIGLAGTGLAGVGNNYNGYAIGGPPTPEQYGWTYDLAAAPAVRRSYTWNGTGTATAGSSAASQYSFFVSPGGLFDAQAAYRWDVFAAATTPAGGSMSARRGLAESPYTVNYILPAQPTIAPAAAPGLQKVSFQFPAVPGYDGLSTQGNLIDVTNTSVFYSRLLKSDPTGATVTFWNQGGASSLDFLQQNYLQGPSSAEGRGQFYTAMTSGGSGKLMVILYFGLNDRGRASVPSAHGITPGNSPAAYLDNMTTLIDNVRADWAAAGKDPDDLSFLVNGLYVDGYDATSNDERGRTREFARALHDLALARPDVSFFDIFAHAPDYDTAWSLGYMNDPVHPSLLGATVYADATIAALVPEPAAGATLAAAAIAIGMRRRTRRGGGGGGRAPGR